MEQPVTGFFKGKSICGEDFPSVAGRSRYPFFDKKFPQISVVCVEVCHVRLSGVFLPDQDGILAAESSCINGVTAICLMQLFRHIRQRGTAGIRIL